MARREAYSESSRASDMVNHFNFHKLKSKSDSLLGICPLLKKIVLVLMFYILSHVVSGLLTFSDDLLTGKVHRKPYIFQSTPSCYLIRLRGFMHFFWFYIKKIILSGDVEINPGPQSKRCQEFSICHWNLNSIATHSFIKVSQLKAYITIYNYDVICLSETYRDSSMPFDDNNLEIPGYYLIRVDHPSNSKRGGVCVYYRNSLPLKILDIFYLQECIVFELKIGNKFCKIVSLYRSPNQSQDEFETFTNNLELILDKIFETNPFLVIVLGHFNAKSMV